MKTLKIVISVIAFSVIAIGCSDQLTSPHEINISHGGNGQKPGSRKDHVDEMSKSISTNFVYGTQIRLRPHTSYTFASNNTPYVKFFLYDIEFAKEPDIVETSNDCLDLSISTSSQKDFLSCHGKNLNLSDLTIENMSSRYVDLNVAISGEKRKIVCPESNE